MTTALERLAALKGKDRVVIVSSSALVEWERTSLFQLHQGRGPASPLGLAKMAGRGDASQHPFAASSPATMSAARIPGSALAEKDFW